MTKVEASHAALLDQTGYTCQVDFYNELTDGSFISGIVASFTYEDGSHSVANDPNAHIGPQESLYSADKCVVRIMISMAVRRPDGTVQILNGDSGPAPAGKCWIHEGWGAVPASLVAKGEAKKSSPIQLIQKSTSTRV
jgi:hypothetical protein